LSSTESDEGRRSHKALEVYRRSLVFQDTDMNDAQIRAFGDGYYLTAFTPVSRLEAGPMVNRVRCKRRAVGRYGPFRRYNAGLVADQDVANAAASLAQTQSSIPISHSSASRVIHTISALLGQNPAELADELKDPGGISASPAEIQAGLPCDMLRRRPDIPQWLRIARISSGWRRWSS